MDPKNLVVGLGLGALGAAAVAYYGFAHANDQREIDKKVQTTSLSSPEVPFFLFLFSLLESFMLKKYR